MALLLLLPLPLLLLLLLQCPVQRLHAVLPAWQQQLPAHWGVYRAGTARLCGKGGPVVLCDLNGQIAACSVAQRSAMLLLLCSAFRACNWIITLSEQGRAECGAAMQLPAHGRVNRTGTARFR
jgi:hypothetical protein